MEKNHNIYKSLDTRCNIYQRECENLPKELRKEIVEILKLLQNPSFITNSDDIAIRLHYFNQTLTLFKINGVEFDFWDNSRFKNHSVIDILKELYDACYKELQHLYSTSVLQCGIVVTEEEDKEILFKLNAMFNVKANFDWDNVKELRELAIIGGIIPIPKESSNSTVIDIPMIITEFYKRGLLKRVYERLI